MLSRRNFLAAGAAAALCAPGIVRAHVLMPIRGIVLCEDIPCHGFVERLMVHNFMRSIQAGQLRGLSISEIAVDLNARNSRDINGALWSADRPLGVIRHDASIRDADRRWRRAMLFQPLLTDPS